MHELSDQNWHSAAGLCSSVLTPELHAWLFDAGSFIQRLRLHGAVNPVVEVIKQAWEFPQRGERECLCLPIRSYVLVREVVIKSEGKKWMFARTVFPRETLTGRLRQLAHLKNRSLGSVLFKDPYLQRSEFEINLQPSAKDDWIFARRSVFTLQKKSLLLSEFFLPDLELLCWQK